MREPAQAISGRAGTAWPSSPTGAGQRRGSSSLRTAEQNGHFHAQHRCGTPKSLHDHETEPAPAPADQSSGITHREESPMASKSLYVGNLPYDVTEQDLRTLFEPWGPVAETRLIASRGFGFVEVPVEKSADAITAMNGKEYKGRALVVNEARPRSERSPFRDRDGGGGRPGGGGPPRRGGGRAGGGGQTEGRRDRGDRGARWGRPGRVVFPGQKRDLNYVGIMGFAGGAKRGVPPGVSRVAS